MNFGTPSNDEVFYAIYSEGRTSGERTLALTEGGDRYVYQAVLDFSSDRQAWRITPDPYSGYYTIQSKTTGLYIARQPNVDALIMVDDAYMDDEQTRPWGLWRDDDPNAKTCAIQAKTDPEQKINMLGDGPWAPGKIVFTYHWDGGAPNELWTKVPIVKDIQYRSIQFFIDSGRISDQAPLVAASQIVTNELSTDQENQLHFQFLESHSYSFSKETGVKVTGSVEFKAGLPFVGEGKVKISVETDVSFSHTDSVSDENLVELDVPVTVKAHSAVEVDIIVLRASIDVPYKAQFAYIHPDDTETLVETSGVFTGQNGYNVITNFKPMGTVQRFERTPWNRLANAPRKNAK